MSEETDVGTILDGNGPSIIKGETDGGGSQ